MDPSLLKEREAFKKKAISNPVIESGKRKDGSPANGDSTDTPRKKIKKEPPSSTITSSSAFGPSASLTHRDLFARAIGSSSNNFSILAKIIKHMKYRFSQGDADAVTLEELLEDTNQIDISSRQRQWLETEALRSNPKVEITEDGKYKFKPAFKLENRKSLLRLLDKYDREGKGGIPLEDIQESLPKAERIIKNLLEEEEPRIIVLTRPTDKKKAVYYNDTSMALKVDEDFHKLWRSVAVDGIDEQKIEEYLQKQGITSMQDMSGGKKGVPIQKRKKPATKRMRNFKKTNDHVADILQDYSDKQE